MSEPWRGVHPASIAVNLVPRLFSLVRSAWPLLLAALYGGWSRQGFADLVLFALFFGSGLTMTTIHALTLRYRVVEGRLEIRSGLLDRQARVVAANRIQNVELVQNVFQRLSGLVEVRLETASGREAEGLLSAITSAEGERLVAALSAARGDAPVAAADEPPDELLVENGPTDLVWASLGDLRLGLVAVAFGLGLELLPVSGASEDLGRYVSGPAGPAIALAIVSGVWLFGLGTSVIGRYGFRLWRTRRGFVAEQGLFTRRRVELRRAKVQLLTWREPVALRLFGLGALLLETAAAREGSGTERSEAVVPLVDPDVVNTVVRAALERDGLEATSVELLPPHPISMRRALLGAVARGGVVAGVGLLLFGPLGLLAGLSFGLFALAAVDDVRHQGFLLAEGVLVVRRGSWIRRTTFVDARKVQSVSVVQGPFLRRLGVAMAVVRVAGSAVTLPLVPVATAVELRDRLIHGSQDEGDSSPRDLR